MLRLPCGKGEIRIWRPTEPVGPAPHSGGGFTCPPGEGYGGDLSPLEPSVPWYELGQLCLRNKAQHNFIAQGRRPRKANHVAIWGDIQ